MPRAGQHRRYGTKPLTAKQRRACLAALLLNCRPEKRQEYLDDPASVPSYGLPLGDVLAELAKVRGRCG